MRLHNIAIIAALMGGVTFQRLLPCRAVWAVPRLVRPPQEGLPLQRGEERFPPLPNPLI
jgi:hypothetical protein